MIELLFNRGAAAIGLLVLSPLFVVLAIAIKVHDGGPVYFRGKRIGPRGKEFHLLKFRSMKAGADTSGPPLTATRDKRITPVGAFLRRRKLDELPQLWNVLVGDMNLVGPRPEDPRYVALYTEVQRQILNYRPGITSPASIRFRQEERMLDCPDWERLYISKVLPEKIALDLDYCRHQSIRGDVQLIWETLAVLLKRSSPPAQGDAPSLIRVPSCIQTRQE